MFSLACPHRIRLHEPMQKNDQNLLSLQQTRVFVFAFAAALVLCLAQPRMLSFLPETVALVCGGLYFFASKKFPPCDRLVVFFASLFLGVAALSALWAPDAAYAFSKVVKTAALSFFGYVLIFLAQNVSPQMHGKKDLFFLFAGAYVFFCLLFFIEYTFHYPVMRFLITNVFHSPLPLSVENAFMYNRSSVFLVLCSAPLLYMLRSSLFTRVQKIFFYTALLFSLALALLHSESQTAQITAVVMAIMYAFPGHRKKARMLFAVVLITGISVMPLLPKPAYDYLVGNHMADSADSFVMKASIPQRLEVWSFVSGEIFKSPLFGHGVESTRTMRAENIMPYFNTDHVLHPHNAALQIWIETGLAGILIVGAFFFFLILRMDAHPPVRQKFYMTLFAGVLSVLAMGYGIWQAWQVGMIMAITAFAIMATRLYEPETRS